MATYADILPRLDKAAAVRGLHGPEPCCRPGRSSIGESETLPMVDEVRSACPSAWSGTPCGVGATGLWGDCQCCVYGYLLGQSSHGSGSSGSGSGRADGTSCRNTCRRPRDRASVTTFFSPAMCVAETTKLARAQIMAKHRNNGIK